MLQIAKCVDMRDGEEVGLLVTAVYLGSDVSKLLSVWCLDKTEELRWCLWNLEFLECEEEELDTVSKKFKNFCLEVSV